MMRTLRSLYRAVRPETPGDDYPGFAIGHPDRKGWIAAHVKGKTFADVGGLWGTVNEKVTVALKAGAAEAAMIDYKALDHEEWKKFADRCAQESVSGYRCLQGDLNDPDLAAKVGTYDVVYCSGILYHAPNPVSQLAQLSNVCRDVLILGSAIIPHRVSNAHGRIALEPGSALFVPALSEVQKAVVLEDVPKNRPKRRLGLDSPPLGGWRLDNYGPWWWLLTPTFISSALEVAGFKVLERFGHETDRLSGASFLARKA